MTQSVMRPDVLDPGPAASRLGQRARWALTLVGVSLSLSQTGCISLQHLMVPDAHPVQGPTTMVLSQVVESRELEPSLDVSCRARAGAAPEFVVEVAKAGRTMEKRSEVIRTSSTCTCWPGRGNLLGLFDAVVIIGEIFTLVPILADYPLALVLGHDGSCFPPGRHRFCSRHSFTERWVESTRKLPEPWGGGKILLLVDDVAVDAVLDPSGDLCVDATPLAPSIQEAIASGSPLTGDWVAMSGAEVLRGTLAIPAHELRSIRRDKP